MRTHATLSLLLMSPLITFIACSKAESNDLVSEQSILSESDRVPSTVAPAALAPWKSDLLRLAFDAASKFPINPHKKNRGRVQDLVVSTCFELDQPNLALSFAPRIVGWRRGVAFADYAWCCAKQGDGKGVAQYVRLAESVLSDMAADPTAQEWRADKVLHKIARAWSALGQIEKASAALRKVDPTSSGAVDAGWSDTVASRVEHLTKADARDELRRIENVFLAQSLGEQFTSLLIIGAVYDRFYQEEGLRSFAAELILERFVKLPPKLRLDVMAKLVATHIRFDDKPGAYEVIRQMDELISSFNWRAEELLPERARIAKLMFDAGHPELAKQELEKSLLHYHEHRDEVVNIYRCETLRSLAIAWHHIGVFDRANDLMEVALEEGLENPNSRPRCDDLVESCLALVRAGMQPSEDLWRRVKEISKALGEPW